MSIFDTTAPTDFNSFGNPLNPANLNSGWSINPNYLTPAYNAPYRPPYSGGGWGGVNANPGFFQSAYGLSPFNLRGTPYGVGNIDQNSAYWDSVGYKPNDAMMAMAQRIAVPLIAFGGATAFANAWQKPTGTGPEFAGARMWHQATGNSKYATMGGFAAAGSKFGGGAVESMLTGMFGSNVMSGGSIGAMAARGAVGLGGAIGGAAIGIGGPLALAQGGLWAADKLVFQHYIAASESQNLLRKAFSGVTFGEGVGNSITGQGINRRASALMGGELAAFGAKDQVFNGREINSLTSMASQMGMLDNVPADQIVSRMKSITKQVKLIMSMANTTDFKDTMGIMAKLMASGVGSNNLSSVYTSINSYASQAGISSTRLFNTMGMQGQYLFGSNGMTPYVGQLVAGNAAAGFASAYRNGLISNDAMARMGGIEGATQSAVTGQLAAAQTPYNMIRGFNRYTSGMGGQGVIGNTNNFQRAFAGDPIGAAGNLILTGKLNASRSLADDGILGLYTQMREIADTTYLRGNKLNQGQMAQFLMPLMGNDASAVTATMSLMGTYQDPQAMAQRMAGMRVASIRAEQSYREQTEQTRVMAFAPIKYSYLGARAVGGAFAKAFGNFRSDIGGAVDSMEREWNTFNLGGSPESLAGYSVDKIPEKMRLPSLDFKKQTKENLSYNRALGLYKNDIAKLLDAHRSNNKVATAALGGNDYDLETAARTGLISDKFKDPASRAELAKTLRMVSKDSATQLDIMGELGKALDEGVFAGKGTQAERYRLYGIAARLYSAGDLRELKGEQGAELRELMEATGTNMGSVRGLMDRAVVEAQPLHIDLNATGKLQNRNELLAPYLKRQHATVRGINPNRNDYQVGAATALNRLQQEATENRMKNMDMETARRIGAEGKISIASETMMTAARTFSDAVEKMVNGPERKAALNSYGLPIGISGATQGSLIDKAYIKGRNIIRGGD